jgi:hypothetical protein
LLAGVQGDHDGAEARGGKEGHHELAAVAQQQRNPVATPDFSNR